MDMSLERDSSVLGTLFQQIINDMKNTSPLWEDFVAKTSKLHACLRAAIQAIAAYLDAFQKIADAATNSRGASKEIGTALTRVCLRHKAVETRLKTFTAAIMDCLVQPLQEKLEDWKRSVATIDKEHAKEYKRCRTELKKRSTDTLRLQKKARKGQSGTLQSLMDSHMQDVTLRRAELEEVEKKSLRSAMIEERMRYCSFVHMLQPVVKEECEVMSELGHLQEAMQSIALVTKDPHVLPAASEELIHDAKASINLYPESPGGGGSGGGGGGGPGTQPGCSNSLGSRKSSVCSISSMNSSGSSNSPGHPHYPRSMSQLIPPTIRLKPGESSDSGFCSSPALTTQASAANNSVHINSTWPPHSQDAVELPSNADRPHTISSAYEKGHQRPPLTVYTFQNPETINESSGSVNNASNTSGPNTPSTQKSPAGALSRPPLPVRCSSLERPLVGNNSRGNSNNLLQRQCPSPIPAHVTKELSAHIAQQQLQQQQQVHLQQHQQQQQFQQQPQLMQHNNYQQLSQLSSPPTYVNMSELANMAAMKNANLQQQQQHQQQQQQQQQQTQQPQQQCAALQQQQSVDSISSIHSNESAGASHHSTPPNQTPAHQHQSQYTRSQSTNSSSNASSLHSHPSIESTVATSLQGQTPTPSSGSSTPQNHYSPLLTNSPSSTAAGTPSGGSITSGGLTGNIGCGAGGSGGFVYNICSPTPPQSANTSSASDILKITETDSGQGVPNHTTTHQYPNVVSPQQEAATDAASNTQIVNNQETSSPSKADSCSNIVENDERSRASVLQKASMFEKQAAAVKNTPPPPSAVTRGTPTTDSSIYGTRSMQQHQHGHHQQYQHHQQQPQAQAIDQQEVGGGSNTRVTRRSSINTAKPPPPIRRSSSVTPSPNAPTTPTHSNATNLLHHQTHSLNTSTENLPPPPAYLLESSRHFPTIPLAPSSSSPIAGSAAGGGMLNASQKVSEAVKALTALRLQSGSPHNFKRLHGDQEHLSPLSPHQQSVLQSPKYQVDIYTTTTATTITDNVTTSTPRSPLLLPPMHDKDSFEVYYNPYNDLQTAVTNNHLMPKQSTANTDAELDLRNEFSPIYQQLSPKPYHHQHTRSSPSSLSPNNTIIGFDDDRPPPLPPPNPQHYRQQPQQQQPKRPNQSHLQQRSCYDLTLPSLNSNYKLMPETHQKPLQSQEQKQLRNANGEASYGCNSPTSFRTSSPGGIYAQPKILNNMSSFRTPSPGPNNHQAPSSIQATHIPNQPKTNPNLIAQLNARLNNKQQQSQPAATTESVYGMSSASNQHYQHHQQQDGDIYVRSYGQQYAQHQQHQQQQQQQQQQASTHGHRQEQSQQQQTYDDYASAVNADKTGSIRTKAKAEFLENLNAKLAKQGLSGRAFAVRNLINSKALPDPRICHESLMDQIKRGATLKRNQKINDRSAPKIY